MTDDIIRHGGKRAGAGRKKGTGIRILGSEGRVAAMRYADKAIKTLVDMLSSPSHAVRVAAANSILDRAYGKPAQAIDLSGQIDHTNREAENDAADFTSAISGLIARGEAHPNHEDPDLGDKGLSEVPLELLGQA